MKFKENDKVVIHNRGRKFHTLEGVVLSVDDKSGTPVYTVLVNVNKEKRQANFMGHELKLKVPDVIKKEARENV